MSEIVSVENQEERINAVELAPPLDISHIETEDDAPVDNIFSAKQQRLLVEPLYSSLPIDYPFLADANVGIFYQLHTPPIVPDMLLSLEVEVNDDWWPKENRSYFIWEFGKPPDVVIEVVSNKKGGELLRKLRDYARIGARYYVIFDPQRLLQDQTLAVYELHARGYQIRPDYLLPEVELSLTLWDGTYEGGSGPWLRWCDLNGVLILTGAEQAAYERNRAEEERNRADRLLAQLRAAGIEPEV